VVVVVSEPVVGRIGGAGDTVVEVVVEEDEVDVDVDVDVDVVLLLDEEVDTELGTVGTVETVEEDTKVVDCPVTVYVETYAPRYIQVS
jgi:hypothetical protein